MKIGLWFSILLAAGASPAGAMRAPAPLAAAATAAGEAQPREADERREIVVTGTRLPGAALGDLPPEMQLTPRDTAAFGAGTIGELLERLAPQTSAAGSAGGGPPLVLVNGQRSSGYDEIRNLPPEAVLRIDILPEDTALRYGLRPGSKVVNIVLRPNFHAVAAEAGAGAATAGGRPSAKADVTVTRITPVGRWSLSAGYTRAAALLESERPVVDGAGAVRTLLPATRGLTLGGSFARDIVPGTAGSIALRFEESRGRSLVGSTDAGGAPPLRRLTHSRAASAAAAANGSAGSWSWSLSASHARSRQLFTTDFGAGPQPERVRIVSNTAGSDLQLLAHGGLVQLPAGEATASLSARVDRFVYRNRAGGPLGRTSARLARNGISSQASIDLPLLAQGGLGEASLNLNAEIGRVSGFGRLRTIGGGTRWAPARWIQLTFSLTDTEDAPDVQSLGEPVVATPNVRQFDFSTGETVDLVRIDGGNPDLAAERRRSFRAGLSLRPLPRRNVSVTASFSRSRTRNPVGSLSAPLPAFEAAFPERFERDAAGRLVRFDARPISFLRAERDELRWGFSFFKSAAAPAAPAAEPLPPGAEAARGAGFDLAQVRGSRREPPTVQLALYHHWRLRDRLLIAPDIPALDFLDGEAAGPRGGSPRHRLEVQAAVHRAGLGARLTGSWQSGTRVDAAGGAGQLRYGDLARLDLRLFADLGERRGLVRKAPWLRSTRLSLEVDNLLDARPRVRDAAGATPAGLQPVLLDPLGRSVRLSLRKLF